MSLLSSIILPKLEKQLVTLDPVMAKIVMAELKSIALDVYHWVENKSNIDASIRLREE